MFRLDTNNPEELLKVLKVDMMLHHLKISSGFRPAHLWAWVDRSHVNSIEYLENSRNKIIDSWTKFKCTGHGAIELGRICNAPEYLKSTNIGLESTRYSSTEVFLKMNVDEYLALMDFVEKQVNSMQRVDQSKTINAITYSSQQPNGAYCLVADYVVCLSTNMGEFSYRLQKYVDINCVCSSYVIVLLEPSSIANNEFNQFMNVQNKDIPDYIPSNIKKNNILVTLEISHIASEQLETKSISVYNMITNLSRNVLPSKFKTVAQYYCSRTNQSSITDLNRCHYENLKANTLTIDEFVDEFNALDNITDTAMNSKQIYTLHTEVDKSQSQIKRIKEECLSLKETMTTLAKDIRDEQSIMKCLSETSTSSLYTDLADTKKCLQHENALLKITVETLGKDLQDAKAQLTEVNTTNIQLKCEIDTMTKIMMSMFKDIAYLKTVAPMIDI